MRINLSGCLLTLALCLPLLACEERVVEVRRDLLLFGTIVEMETLTTEPARVDKALSEVAAYFTRLERDWYPWREDGELVRVNRALKLGNWVRVDQDLKQLLEEGTTLAHQSGGRFNPAIAELIQLWGVPGDEFERDRLPEAEKIAAWVEAAPSLVDLVWEGNRVRTDNPQVQLDLGAFAKGYALDRGRSLLKAQGIQDLILNGGGDVCVAGDHRDRAWRVGIRDPQGKGVIAGLDLRDGECVMTSGDYERFIEIGGRRYSHILDPRTGWPAREFVSVTVVHKDGARADAVATALSVADVGDWTKVARDMGVDEVLLIARDGAILVTPLMAARIDWLGHRPEQVEVVPL